MNEIQTIETKVENGGTTPQGRVSAAEFNILADAAKRFDVSKYGSARITEEGKLQFFADAASMIAYEADPTTNAALLLKSLTLPIPAAVDISGKLDKEEFYRFFEEVNIGTAEAPVYATRSKRGLFVDGFLSAMGLNSSGGGGGGGTTYDRLDAWADYTAERAGWVLSAALGYELHNRVRSLEGGSALSFTTEGSGNVVTAVKKSGTSVTVTKGLTALTSHQPIYALTFQAGAFEAKKYTPNTGVTTVNIPTKTSHLSNDSGFITSSALTPYITATTANATFATKLGVSGNQIGTYVNGKLGNLITVPYATNADTLDALHSADFFRQYAVEGGLGKTFDFNSYTNGGYVYNTTDINDAKFSNAPFTSSPGGFGLLVLPYSSYRTQLAIQYASNALYARCYYWSSSGREWSEWRQFAYTDMNVASATKLQTARTLWGQSFDGSKNVSGNMTGVGSISATGEIKTTSVHSFRTIYGDYGAFWRNDGSALYLLFTEKGDPNGTFNSLRPFYIEFNSGIVRIGGSSALNVQHAGNVGIGIANPAHKLDVNGDARVTGNFRLNGSYLFLKHYQATGGIYFATDTNGDLSISKHSNYAFSGSIGKIVYSSGNVGIGTSNPAYKLDVTGVIHSTSGIFSDGYMSAKGINTASDMRLKRRIADVALTVRDVAEAPVYRFQWINGGDIDVGSTAQYWAARVPELTHLLQDGIHLGLDYGKAALLSVVSVARATADHERRIADIERQLQNRTI